MPPRAELYNVSRVRVAATRGIMERGSGRGAESPVFGRRSDGNPIEIHSFMVVNIRGADHFLVYGIRYLSMEEGDRDHPWYYPLGDENEEIDFEIWSLASITTQLAAVELTKRVIRGERAVDVNVVQFWSKPVTNIEDDQFEDYMEDGDLGA